MTGTPARPAGFPQALYDADGSRRVDQEAMRLAGLTAEAFMARAAQAALTELRRRYPSARRVAIVAGPGRNGGDGRLVAAQAGLPMVVDVIEPGVMATEAVTQRLASCDVVVDALFGTGLKRPPEGCWREAIVAVNHAGRPVFALDVPSGVDASTGNTPGVAVRADATLCFVTLKVGLFTGNALDYRGLLLFDPLDVPPSACERIAPVAWRMRDPREIRLPVPRPNTHKGEMGRVLIIGGGPGMPGAARLAGEAAYTGGAGLVVVATHRDHAACLNVAVPELIVYGIDDLSVLKGRHFEALAVGCGLGQDAWAEAMWAGACAFPGPLVVDGDALRMLARAPTHRSNVVLTPHPGEAAALLGCSPAEIQADRRAAAAEIVGRFGGVCVLKGAGTIVADGRHCYVCDCGGPALATAGTGDVLTGLVAAFLGRGLAAPDAARLAVMLHGRAGENAPGPGLRASGLLPWIWHDPGAS
ncbi:MAG: NAD(P)H-hydrate dehydratase [Acidiferrobacteraceae bacterium]